MAQPPNKRRKMRPNNAIALERAKTESLLQETKQNKQRNSKEPQGEHAVDDVKVLVKNTRHGRKNPAPVQTKASAYSSASDSDETDNENAKDMEPKSTKRKAPSQKGPRSKTTAKQKEPLSDSDDTDDEQEPTITAKEEQFDESRSKKININKQQKAAKDVVSASDSDETDNEQTIKPEPMSGDKELDKETIAKLASIPQDISTHEDVSTPQNAPTSQDASTSQDISTQDTSTPQAVSVPKPKPASKPRKSKAKPKAKSKVTPKTQRIIQDSSDNETSNEAETEAGSNESGSNSAPNANPNSDANTDPNSSTTDNVDPPMDDGMFRESVTKRNHLVGNRLSFRRRGEYDSSKSAAVNLSKRLNDSFLPNVQHDYFVSDSDSEPDSGEDYEMKDYPTWQRTFTWNRNPEEDPWPKQRRFGYSDKLKLEKRIKKICKRENMTFHEAQEIFSSGKRKQHLRFFQKIAAAFPNVPLYLLVKRLKETYHIKRNSSPWTKEEIKTLEELLKIHGNNAELLSTMMDRSPKNINDFIFNHKSAKKASKRWTKEEDELLAKVMAKEEKNAAGRVSFLSVEPFFQGERSQKQIYARYYNIRHRIQPDGTLVDNRPATPIEELDYLKSLLQQVNDHDLIEESQLDYAKKRGFVKANFYLNSRTNIKEFEKMTIKDILNELIRRQETIVESRRGEGLLQE